MADLSDYRLVGFSHARMYLGPAFDKVAGQAVSYSEISAQERQIEALFNEQADVIIADKTIFEFYRKKLRNNSTDTNKFGQEVSMDFSFPGNDYHVAFKSAVHQEAFNRGLEKLQSTGRYQQIFDTYLGLLKQY